MTALAIVARRHAASALADIAELATGRCEHFSCATQRVGEGDGATFGCARARQIERVQFCQMVHRTRKLRHALGPEWVVTQVEIEKHSGGRQLPDERVHGGHVQI